MGSRGRKCLALAVYGRHRCSPIKRRVLFIVEALVRHPVPPLSSKRSCRREPPSQLIVLEPSLSPSSSLPILKASTDVSDVKLATPTRERRVRLEDGLKWLFGRDAVGAVEELGAHNAMSVPGGAHWTCSRLDEHSDGDVSHPISPTHSLTFPAHPNVSFPILRRRCGRGEWASANAPDLSEEGVDGDRGGWRWEWFHIPSAL